MNNNFNIEGSKLIVKSNLCEKVDTFEIVEKIPDGFMVWNIGDNMASGYLPLCELVKAGEYDVNTNTLKAIKMEQKTIELLNKAAAWGVSSLKDANKAIKSKRSGYTADRKRALANATIDIYNRITA